MDGTATPTDAYGVLPTGAYSTEEVHALIVNLDTATRQAIRLENRVLALQAENADLRAQIERAKDVTQRLMDERDARREQAADAEIAAWTPPPLPESARLRAVPAGG